MKDGGFWNSRWLALPVLAAVASLVLSTGFAFWRTPGDAGTNTARAGETSKPTYTTPAAPSGASVPSGFSESAEFVAPAYEPASIDPHPGGDDPAPFDCIIEPAQVVELGSAVSGVIEKVHLERGDDVTAGQVVVELEAGTEKAAVELARARARMDGDVQSREASLELGKQRLERARELFDHKALSLDVRQEVETETELAELELKRAKQQREIAQLDLERSLEALKRRTLRSPIDGVVVDRMLSPGEVVDEDPVVRIAQLDPLRVEVILPSAMFGTVQPGMWGAVTPEIPGDRVHAALVTIVDRVVDSASGTFGVQLELRNPDRKIAGGLHCRVSFIRE